MRKFVTFFLALSLFVLSSASAHAQATSYAEIVSVDARAFPQITALMNVYDANGRFIEGLKPADLTAHENGEPRPVDALTESAVPVQLVVAVNPGPSLAVRDGNAVQRFAKVVEALSNWVNAQPSDLGDDLSLVSLSGSLITHAKAKDWFVSLDSFKPDFRNTTPNLQTFSIALDTVTATTSHAGMKRAILFITPHMDDPNIDNTVAPLIERAVELNVRVFVWFVDGEQYFVTPSANAFKSLALQTNGSFFAVNFQNGQIIGSGGNAVFTSVDGTSTLDLLVNPSLLTNSGLNGFRFNVHNDSILNATFLDSNLSGSGQAGVAGEGNGDALVTAAGIAIGATVALAAAGAAHGLVQRAERAAALLHPRAPLAQHARTPAHQPLVPRPDQLGVKRTRLVAQRPRERAVRGSQISLAHPEAWGIDQALIEELATSFNPDEVRANRWQFLAADPTTAENLNRPEDAAGHVALAKIRRGDAREVIDMNHAEGEYNYYGEIRAQQSCLSCHRKTTPDLEDEDDRR